MQGDLPRLTDWREARLGFASHGRVLLAALGFDATAASMLAVRSLVLVLACSAPLLACSQDEAEGDTAEEDLVGGRLARRGEFDTTMQVQGNCTVTKVGPRYVLTAAHCVTSAFYPGATIELTNAKALGRFARSASAKGYTAYTIERIEIEPAWSAACADGVSCGSVHISGRSAMADAALLVTTEDIVDVPEAAIDLAPVVEGDRVAVTGYGCEDQVAGTWDYSGSRLRVSETFSIPFEDTVHPGSFIKDADRASGVLEQMRGIYVITPGPEWVRTASTAAAPEHASGGRGPRRGGLCPGDSGGPLYRLGNTAQPTVVGINANYTFSGGTEYTIDGNEFNYGGRPRTNWQTRVDAVSGLRVGAWLRSLGVNTVCSRGTCE